MVMEIVQMYSGLQQQAQALMDAADMTITMRQMEIIDCIKRGMPIHEINKVLGVIQSAIAQQISKLEAEGLIKKYADPRDARVTLLRVTLKGNKAYNERGAHALKLAVEILAPLTNKELIQYREMLLKVNHNFQVTVLPFN